jgi:hypothetical protein
VNRKRVGTLDVRYAEKRPRFCKTSFLEEEVFLLEAIANMIGQAIERITIEEEKVRLHCDIQNAYERILTGIIPICASCKSIRDEKGEWHTLETYVQKRTEAMFSHGICPVCVKKLYPSLKGK